MSALTTFPKSQEPKPQNVTVSLTNRFVALDGLNIAWQGPGPHLPTLLTIAIEIAQTARDFHCVFDANAAHRFWQFGRPVDVDALNYLVNNYNKFFSATTGGTRADDMVLALGAAHHGIVVSNDRFRYSDQRAQHPWVSQDGRILRVNRVRDRVLFNSRLLLIHGIYASMNRLECEIKRKFKA
jgi:hypothetical protein